MAVSRLMRINTPPTTPPIMAPLVLTRLDEEGLLPDESVPNRDDPVAVAVAVKGAK